MSTAKLPSFPELKSFAAISGEQVPDNLECKVAQSAEGRTLLKCWFS